MLNNQEQAEKHFEEKSKAYKPGIYFITSDGQIFDDKIFAMERVRTKRAYSLKIFTVVNKAKADEKPKKKSSKPTSKADSKKDQKKDSADKQSSPAEDKSEDDKKEDENPKK